jgi:hypothetical protein
MAVLDEVSTAIISDAVAENVEFRGALGSIKLKAEFLRVP